MNEKNELTYRTLTDILRVNAEKFSAHPAVAFAGGISYSYSELSQLSKHIARMLYGLGLEKGDKAAVISENHPHWSASYFGILNAGGITVPVLPDFQYKEMFSILEHSAAKIAVISSKQLKKFSEGFPASIQHVMLIETMEVMEADKVSFPESEVGTIKIIEENSGATPGAGKEKEWESMLIPERDDIASIIYTSGTTGRSKGVMLSHENLLSNAVQARTLHQVRSEDVFLSVLPLAHTYECTIGMLVPLVNGASITYIDRAPTASYLGPLLKELRPTTMLTVPLIIEKIYKSRIKPGIQGSPVTRTLAGFAPTRKLVHRMAGKKLKAFFGGRMRFFGVGGAPLAPEVEKFLINAKFPYAIGYGLTETAPLLAGFGPDKQVYRSVGTVLEGVDIRIDKPDPVTGEGEIVARGPNIMKGYYNNQEMTDEVFTSDGYFKTGDLGTFNEKGILYIKGRLKNMILGPNGENIYPEEIEAVLNTMDYVDESMVYDAKGKLTALVYMNLEQLEEKFRHMLVSTHDKQVILQKKAEEILQELKQTVNEHLAINSRLQQVVLQTVPFEKTPTKKIKRFLYTV